jgi:hypothetical protein
LMVGFPILEDWSFLLLDFPWQIHQCHIYVIFFCQANVYNFPIFSQKSMVKSTSALPPLGHARQP